MVNIVWPQGSRRLRECAFRCRTGVSVAAGDQAVLFNHERGSAELRNEGGKDHLPNESEPSKQPRDQGSHSGKEQTDSNWHRR